MLSDVDYMSEGDEFGHQNIDLRVWKETYDTPVGLGSSEKWILISYNKSAKKEGIHDI